jgi:hypothetical protein
MSRFLVLLIRIRSDLYVFGRIQILALGTISVFWSSEMKLSQLFKNVNKSLNTGAKEMHAGNFA